MNTHHVALGKWRPFSFPALIVTVLTSCTSAPLLKDYCGPLSQDIAGQIDQDKMTRAMENSVYAVLSNNVYKPAGHPEIWVDSNEWQAICDERYQIKNKYNSPDCEPENPGKGLEARTYLRWRNGVNHGQPTELVFVFRGTTSVTDWWCGNIWDCQYGEAGTYIKARIDKYRGNYPGILIIATGHSLGGGLAQHVAFCIEGAKAVAFNTSPRSHKHDCDKFTSEKLTEVQEENIKKNNIVRIHQHEEILSAIRHIFSSKKYVDTAYDFTTGSLVARHGMTPLAIGLTKITACPIQTGLNGFSASGERGAEMVLTRTCTSESVEFHCSKP